MKQKVLFEVILPVNEGHYDFWVPRDASMQIVTQLISQAMQVIEPDFYLSTPDAALLYVRTGEIQNPFATVAEIGFTNGDKFILI